MRKHARLARGRGSVRAARGGAAPASSRTATPAPARSSRPRRSGHAAAGARRRRRAGTPSGRPRPCEGRRLPRHRRRRCGRGRRRAHVPRRERRALPASGRRGCAARALERRDARRERRATRSSSARRFGDLRAAEGGMVVVGVVGDKVAYVSSSLTGDTALAAQPALTAAQAWTKAAANVGREVSVLALGKRAAGRGLDELRGRRLAQPQRARLVAVPTPTSGVRPAWETLVVESTAAPRRPTALRRRGDRRGARPQGHRRAVALDRPRSSPARSRRSTAPARPTTARRRSRPARPSARSRSASRRR